MSNAALGCAVTAYVYEVYVFILRYYEVIAAVPLKWAESNGYSCWQSLSVFINGLSCCLSLWPSFALAGPVLTSHRVRSCLTALSSRLVLLCNDAKTPSSESPRAIWILIIHNFVPFIILLVWACYHGAMSSLCAPPTPMGFWDRLPLVMTGKRYTVSHQLSAWM